MAQVRDWTPEVQKLFKEKLFVQIDSPDKDLLASGVLDSMALVELLVNLEESFGVRISLAELDMDHFRSLRSIAQLVSASQPQAMQAGRPA